MAIDTEDKRRSIVGLPLPVYPVPDASIALDDHLHFAGYYRLEAQLIEEIIRILYTVYIQQSSALNAYINPLEQLDAFVTQQESFNVNI